MSGQILSGRASRSYIAALATLLFSLQLHVIVRADDAAKSAGNSPASTPSSGHSKVAASSEKARQEHIQKLIDDLGNPRFATRRSASNELRQIGAEAFDALNAATENPDLEIAASANYLLRQIAVRWVQVDDPAAVRSLLRQYGQEQEPTRLQRIEMLARLPQGAGSAALCRIARYDRSPIVSRTAALAIIRPKDAEATRPKLEASQADAELGGSTRTAAGWLHQYVAQFHDPPASIAVWKKLIDQESARLEKSSAETSNEILLGLLWNLADLYRQTGDQTALTGVLDRMLVLAAEGSDETIVNLIVWLTQNKSWDVLDSFLTKNQSRLEQSKRPLYYAAIARIKQGKPDIAEQLAKTASNIEGQSARENIIVAKDLEEHDQYEWSVREYRRVIDKQQAGEPEIVALAKTWLSGLLHDHEQHKEAADTLEQLVKSLQGDGNAGQNLAKLRASGRSDVLNPDAIASRYHFYRAEQYLAEKDYKRARGSLELAIKFYPEDADVLIAMYNLPESDPKWQSGVKERITQLTQKFQQEIDQDPTDPSPYNQWAWVVSNTEGDFQKAIRYSHRSLELNDAGETGEASYLDTLGRCYFAAGDYENAVKYERQAISKVSHMQVMHRQLAEFEKALAEKNAKSSDTDKK
jgi:tetratricopeptide (TPR) repeat protein